MCGSAAVGLLRLGRPARFAPRCAPPLASTPTPKLPTKTSKSAPCPAWPRRGNILVIRATAAAETHGALQRMQHHPVQGAGGGHHPWVGPLDEQASASAAVHGWRHTPAQWAGRWCRRSLPRLSPRQVLPASAADLSERRYSARRLTLTTAMCSLAISTKRSLEG